MNSALARWLSWLRRCPAHQKLAGSTLLKAQAQVAGLIPVEVCTGGYQWMFLSHTVFLSLLSSL